MKEIIVIGVGSCGINLTTSYLSLMTKEHGIYNDKAFPNNETNVHFNLNQKNNPQARFLFIDTDTFSVDKVLANPLSGLISEDNVLSCNVPSFNVAANAKYLKEKDQFDRIEQSLQKEIEKCDSIQQILINCSVIGGAGSGLTTNLIDSCYNKYDLQPITNIIFPALHRKFDVSNENTLGIYNSILSFPSVIPYSKFSVISDNKALENLSEFDYVNDSSFQSLNHLNSKMISCLTSGTRFSGLQPASLKKIQLNSIPFRRMHFFSAFYFKEDRFSPNFIENTKKKSMEEGLGGHFTFGAGEKSISRINLYRGEDFSSSEIEEVVNYFPSKKEKWNMNDITSHVSRVSDPKYSKEACYLYSGLFLADYFEKLKEEFFTYFRRKVFLHWYTGAGMDEMEFFEAESNLQDLISEYRMFDNTQTGEEEDFE